jgi:uncharacterized protein (DUF885 family)
MLSATDRLSADVLEWQLASIVNGAPFAHLNYPLEQFRGANVTLADTLTIAHPIASKQDGDNYVARLRLVPVRMREAIAEARRVDALGIRPPTFIINATIAGMRIFIGVPPQQSPFVTALAQKLATVNGLAAPDRDALVAQATQIVARDVTPAWQEAIALLESQLPRSTDDAGLWRLPNGAAAYAWQLQANTTTKLTADEIHAIGLEQVKRIEGEMETILGQLGRTAGTLTARIEQLKKEQAYPLTEDGRRQIMSDIDVIMKDAQERSKSYFELTPKAAVVAQASPKYQEATAAGSYLAPAPDGTRPGTFQIPLRPNRMTRFGLKTLVYHETVPGHHYQIALSQEDTSQPRFRQAGLIGRLPAIVEGWGLYAEQLAVEAGWYSDDPIGRLGQLDGQLFRARRLVVDTGLHAKHWTRQQAIDYGIEASEIDRYVVMPGQACAYMVGQLEIVRQREKARQALGTQFSLRAFHTAVQRIGIVPLDLLDRSLSVPASADVSSHR